MVWNNTYNFLGQIDSLCDLEHYQILPEIYLGQIDSLCDFGHYQTLPKMCWGKLTPSVIWNITWNISGQIDFLFDLWHYLKLFGANWLPQVIWSISSLFSANLLPLWFGILLETILGKLTPSRDSEHLFIIQGKLTSLCDLEYYQTLPDIARTPPTLAGGLRIPKNARVGGDGKNCVVLGGPLSGGGGSRRTGG